MCKTHDKKIALFHNKINIFSNLVFSKYETKNIDIFLICGSVFAFPGGVYSDPADIMVTIIQATLTTN